MTEQHHSDSPKDPESEQPNQSSYDDFSAACYDLRLSFLLAQSCPIRIPGTKLSVQQQETAEILAALDPLRPVFRRLALFQLSEGNSNALCLDIDTISGWRFSPTAQFMYAAALVADGSPQFAGKFLDESERIWTKEIFPYEDLGEDQIQLIQKGIQSLRKIIAALEGGDELESWTIPI